MLYIHTQTHTCVCAKFHNFSSILVRAYTLMNVKILAFGNSNIYFIYFITFLYSKPYINSTCFFFFTPSFKYSLNIIFYSHYHFSLFLSGSFASLLLSLLWSLNQDQPFSHQQLHNSEKTFHCQIPTTRSHNKEKAYTKPEKKKGRWSVVTRGERDPRTEIQAKKF